MLSAEQIEKNWKTFQAQLQKLGDRKDAVLKMFETVGDRMMMCPASSRKSFHRSCPGGLVDHSLRVLVNVIKLNKAFSWGLPESSMVLAALLHDFGKIGDLEHDNYVEAESWKQKKFGELYQYNPAIRQMSVPHRSVFLLQHFGVTLTQDEFLAITLNDGFVVEANREYCLREPRLATAVWMSDYLATVDEKTEEAAEAAKNEAKTETAEEK